MKIRLIYAVFALMVMVFAGCTQADDPIPGEQELLISARETGFGGLTTEAFTRDFNLALWSTTDATQHETHRMTYDGTDWNTVSTQLLPASALAYCGQTVTVTSHGQYSVALTKDQSNADAFHLADVMIATGMVDENGSLSLHFKHHYAKVTFRVTLADEFQGSEPISHLSVVTKDENVSEVITHHSVTDGYSAYIPAGTYSAGQSFVKVAIGAYMGDNRLTSTLNEGMTLKAGTHYKFDIRVGKDKVQLTLDSDNHPFGSGWKDTDLN